MKTRTLIELALVLALILIPELALGEGPYGYGPPPGSAPPWATPAGPATALRIERSADQDNYYLILHLSGIEPQGVTVTRIGGRRLRISSQESYATHHEDVAQDRSAWRQGFSYRSGGIARQIGLPRDADVSALRREDGTDQVKIILPRRR